MCRHDRHCQIERSPKRFKGDNKMVAFTILSTEITDRKIMEEKLRNLSLHNEMTGLYNRRGFFTMAEQYLQFAQIHGRDIYMSTTC